MPRNPFAFIDDLTIEYVDSAAGSRKTLTAIEVAMRRARRGIKTIFAMPTLELVHEMVGFARLVDVAVPVVEITSRDDQERGRKFTIPELIRQHISGTDYEGERLATHITRGHLLFITHEAYHRMLRWPPETAEFEIVIDEALDVILTRAPFKLRDWGSVLTSFLDVYPAPASLYERRARTEARSEGRVIFTARDARHLAAIEALLRPQANASIGEVEQAQRQRDRLLKKKADAEEEAPLFPYYVVVPRFDEQKPDDDPWARVMRRISMEDRDDIYAYVRPVPHWLAQNAPLFTDMVAWDRMTNRSDYRPDRGRITISGFRRPDALKSFGRVTVMSALFPHTLMHHVWSQLGVEFRPSQIVRVSVPVTALGARRLRIYWLSEHGWSKRARDKAGGIGVIFDLIRKSGAINRGEPVCVCTNKDDASEDDPRVLRDHFENAVIMPHNSRGQNRFRVYHQLIHTAALNSYTPDIRWMEVVLGVGAREQRIARTGQEVYQTLMRLSLREPSSRHDVTVVVMDRDVAEWLPQWFAPADQVEIIEIDSSGVVRPKKKPGRPRILKPMTAAERKARSRRKGKFSPGWSGNPRGRPKGAKDTRPRKPRRKK